MNNKSFKLEKLLSDTLPKSVANSKMSNPEAAHTNSQDINNPYQIPVASLDNTTSATLVLNQSKWYQGSGRIGRLRYLAYQMLMSVLMYLVLIITLALYLTLTDNSVTSDASLGWLLAIYLPLLPILFYTAIIYPRRRLHDLNKSGWMVLILFIPFVNMIFYLYLILAKGDSGVNRFGAPPRPNRTIHYIGGFAMPVIFAIGILAAIAIPAYSSYTERVIQQKIENARD